MRTAVAVGNFTHKRIREKNDHIKMNERGRQREFVPDNPVQKRETIKKHQKVGGYKILEDHCTKTCGRP